jgi:hypothetical protein
MNELKVEILSHSSTKGSSCVLPIQIMTGIAKLVLSDEGKAAQIVIASTRSNIGVMGTHVS